MPSLFEVTEEDLARDPVKLVHFNHGRLKSEESHKVSWNVYKRKRAAAAKAAAPDRQILTASVNGMVYSAQNFGQQVVNSTDACNYFLAVRNKSSNKVRVLRAELYKMEPKFEDQKEKEENNSTLTLTDKKNDLAKEFGSGRSQRAVMQREKNKFDEDMVSATTQKVADSVHTNQQIENTESTSEKTEISAVPPHDKDAKTPGDVYKLKDIIKEEIMPSLATQGQIFVSCTKEDIEKWSAEKKYPLFVLGKVETLAMREDARLFQSQCLMYLSCLMKLYLLKYADIRRKYPLPEDWPEPVKKSLLDTFTLTVKDKSNRSSRVMPGRLKDLLLSHILVLCLKLSGFYLELNSLIKDLNIAQKKLSTHASALGCTVKTVKDPKDKSVPAVYFAELKVPLKFPEVRGKSNKKRIF